jgi:hypothetical protein
MLAALLLAAATAAPPKPLRQLEFSFHYAGTTESISHYSGIETVLPGVGTTFSSGGYDGKIYVDVLGAGQNDTLVLAIRQEVPLSHSLDVPSGEVLVYPTGQVDLPPNAAPLRQPELNLARFLGRKFINGDYLDEKNHWRIDFTLPDKSTVATDFTITKNNGGILDITEAQKVVSAMGGMQTEGRITYDMNRTVPLTIHEQSGGMGSNAGLRFTYDYTLIADSLAPPKP